MVPDLKKLVLLIAIVLGYSWSIFFIYVNLDMRTGTGPVFGDDNLTLEMNNLDFIFFSGEEVEYTHFNSSFLQLIALENTYENRSSEAFIDIRHWIDRDKSFNLSIYLYGMKNAYFTIHLYAVKEDRSSLYGNLYWKGFDTLSLDNPKLNDSISCFSWIIDSDVDISIIRIYVGVFTDSTILIDKLSITEV